MSRKGTGFSGVRLGRLIVALALLMALVVPQGLAREEQHVHVYATEVIFEPSCTEQGTLLRYCLTCRDVNNYEAIPALGHDWSDWDMIREPTCTSEGSRVRYCMRCGRQETQTMPKKEHSWGGWQVTRYATCAVEGSRSHTCRVCGRTQTQSIPRTEHSFGEWTVTVEATPFSQGKRQRTCKNCGTTVTDAFDPEGTLRRGDKGDAVKAFQQALNDAGYDCGKADGDFGGKTEAAVSAFENDTGMTVDGVGWPGVQSMLSGSLTTYHINNTPTIRDGAEVSAQAPGSISAKAGDTLEVPLILTNTGTTVLKLTGYSYGYLMDESAVPGEEVDAGTVDEYTPGQQEKLFYHVVVTEADEAAGVIARAVHIGLYRWDDGTLVDDTSMDIKEMFAISLEGGGTELLDGNYAVISAMPPASFSGAVGDAVDVPVRVTNIGNTVLRVTGYSYGDGGEDPVPGETFDMKDVDILNPGEWGDMSYHVVVTETDEAMRMIDRGVVIDLYRWDGEKLVDDTSMFGSDTFVIPLTQKQENPVPPAMGQPVDALSVTAEAPASAQANVGDKIDALVHVKNTGNTDLYIGGYAYMDTAENAFVPGEDLSGELLEKDPVLKAGASCDLVYTIVVQDTDVAHGKLERSIQVAGNRWDGSTPGETAATDGDEIVISLEEGEPEYDTDGGVIVTKAEKSEPEDHISYKELETVVYEITVTNNHSRRIEGIEVYDDFQVPDLAPELAAVVDLDPGETAVVGYMHMVSADDIALGMLVNEAYASVVPEENAHYDSWSEPVTVWLGEEPEESGLKVKKEVVSASFDAAGYQVSEQVRYRVTVYNDTDDELTGVEVYDEANGEGRRLMATLDLEPNQSAVLDEYFYPVQQDDEDRGYIENTATVEWTQIGDAQPTLTDSDTVRVDVIPPSGVITVTKEVEGKAGPYARGEEVVFAIYVVNTTMHSAYNVEVYDLFDGDPTGELLGTIPELKSNDKVKFEYRHVVTQPEVDKGLIVNQAYIEFLRFNKREPEQSYTDYVQVTTCEPPVVTPAPVEDYCKRILRGRGDGVREYELIYCHEHYPTIFAINTLLESAQSEEDLLPAWQTGEKLLTYAVNDGFTRLAARSGMADIAESERKAFFESLEAYEEALRVDHGGIAAKELVCEQLMNRMVDLCYELHTAPQNRLDSLLTGGYREMDGPEDAPAKCVRDVEDTKTGFKFTETVCESHESIWAMLDQKLKDQPGEALTAFREAREQWMVALKSVTESRAQGLSDADRAILDQDIEAFEKWLDAREKVLMALYSYDEAKVAEVMADTVKNRVFALEAVVEEPN